MFTAGVNQQQRLQKDFSDWADVMLADYRVDNPDQAKFFDMQYAADMATANAASKSNFDWWYIADQDQPAHAWCNTPNSGAGGWAHKNAGWGINSQGQTPGKNFEQNVVKKMFARQINDTYLAHKFGPFGTSYSPTNADFVKIWPCLSTMYFSNAAAGTKTGDAPVYTWGAGYKHNGTYVGAGWSFSGGYDTTITNPDSGVTETPGYVALSTTDGWTGFGKFAFNWHVNNNNSAWRYTIPTFDIPAMTGLTKTVGLYDGWTGWQPTSYRYTAITYHPKRLPSTTQKTAWGSDTIYNFTGIPVLGHQDGSSPIQLSLPAAKIGSQNGTYTMHFGPNTNWYGTPGSYLDITNLSSALQWDYAFYSAMMADFTLSTDNAPPHSYTNNFTWGFIFMNSGTDHFGNTVGLPTWDHTKCPVYDASTMNAGTWPFPWSGSGNVRGPMYTPQFTNHPPTIRLMRAVKAEHTWVRDINYLCIDHVGAGPITFEFSDLFVGLGFGTRYADWWAGAFDCSNVYNCLWLSKHGEHTPLLYNVGAHPNFNAIIFVPETYSVLDGPTAAQLDTFFTNGLADRSSVTSATIYIRGLTGTAGCNQSIATAKNWVVDTTTANPSIPAADF